MVPWCGMTTFQVGRSNGYVALIRGYALLFLEMCWGWAKGGNLESREENKTCELVSAHTGEGIFFSLGWGMIHAVH
jgi:hypothetical protein